MYNPLVDTRSAYIHWPFCPYRCHFCPFVALAGQDEFMTSYHQALVKEIELFAQQMDRKQPIETLFFGGGTPSTYPDHLLLDMFGILKEKFVFADTTEVTIEVNPGTVRPEQLGLWKELGINRISMGVQSLKDGVLQNLNRHQSMADVYKLLDQAPDHIARISVDLILGLPGVSQEEWKGFIQEVVTWPIDHISIYFLTVHEDTPLYFKVQKKAVLLPDDDEIVDLYYWTCNFLEQHGLMQYELSNFARLGGQSRHNTVYWERKPYKAFGLGACSFDGTIRSQNEKNLMKYISMANEQRSVAVFTEELSNQQVYLEKMMLNLRRVNGISIEELGQYLSDEQKVAVHHKINDFVDRGLVEYHESRIKLTVRGLAVENEIVTQLLV